MRFVRATIPALALVLSTAASASELRYIAAREVLLDCTPVNDVPVTAVDLYVSEDAGRTWQKVLTEGVPPTYVAPDDGQYYFYLVLHNAGGASAPPPQAGTRAMAVVVVDTTPPLLQIHDVHVNSSASEVTAEADITFVEEHLSDMPLRLFYRVDGASWIDGGRVARQGDRLTWPIPAQIDAAQIDLRLIAIDRAGNRSTCDYANVRLPNHAAAHEPTDDTAAESADTPQDASAQATSAGDITDVRIDAIEPVTFTAPAPAPQQEPAPTTQPARRLPARDEHLEHLRTLARRFMREGRYALAAARLEDALAASPDDADLLVDLGSAQYRLGRYDQADERFSAAQEMIPDHVGAIEGRALVAATQKRYAPASEHLLHLLRLQPDSGAHWLRYGDVQHRLGRTRDALDAWQRVLAVADEHPDLLKKAQRRLECFDPERLREVQETARSPWQSPESNPPHHSS
jgi:TolA-binding protein